MFTGIIQDCGTVSEIRPLPDGGAALLIHAPHTASHTHTGHSIAVNGVCLTATEIRGGAIAFHTLEHTLGVTNLGTLRPGDTVNLEPALRLGDPLGGHLITGHVDCACPITTWQPSTGEDWLLEITIPQEAAPLVITRGSIALDGISLTIAEISGLTLRVHIIPHTRLHTNLRHKQPGHTLNTEFDTLGKYIHRHLTLAGVGHGTDTAAKFAPGATARL